MRFFVKFAIYFYVSLISSMCVLAILYVGGVIRLNDVVYYLELATNDPVAGLGVASASCAVILISFIFARIISGGQASERTIAFDNPSGRVSVSLSAVEDTIRRLMQRIPEVKEVKPTIIASKKGILIEAKLVLKEDVNIPEMTFKLQDITKTKIHEVLGVDEKVTVRFHIAKIISDQTKVKREEAIPEEKQQPTVPFRGYRS